MAVKRVKFTPGWLDKLKNDLRNRLGGYQSRETLYYDKRQESAHLRIRVMPTCNAYYYIQYRPPLSENEQALIKSGEMSRPGPTTHKIGSFTKIKYKDAVTLAQDAWVNLEQGVDPKHAKRVNEQIEGPTIREAINTKIKARGRKAEIGNGGLSNSYIATMQRQIKTLEKHGFADKRLKEISPEHLKKLMDDIPARIQAEGSKRGTGIETSKKIILLLHSTYRFAMEYYWTDEKPSRPVISTNPCGPLVASKKIKLRSAGRKNRRRAIKQDEIHKVWHAFLELENYVPDRHNQNVINNIVASNYFRFQLLTGVRGGTISQLTFDQYDWRRKTFYFFDEHAQKTKQENDKFFMPLSDEAAEIIDAMHKRHGRLTDYVFPNSTYKMGMDVGCKEQIKIVRRKSGINFKSHDLRGTFLTIADSLDKSWSVVTQLADHTSQTSNLTAGYLDTEVENLRRHTQDICNFILETAGVKKKQETPQLFDLESNPFKIKEELHKGLERLATDQSKTVRDMYEQCLKLGFLAHKHPEMQAKKLLDMVAIF